MNKSWPLLSLHGIGHWSHVGLRSLRRSRWGSPPHIRRLLRPCSIFIAMHLNKTARCNQKYNKQILELHQVHLKTCWFKHFNYCTISGDCTLYWRKGTVAACETSCPFQNPSMISSRMQCDVLHNLNSKAATATPLLDAISLFVFWYRYILRHFNFLGYSTMIHSIGFSRYDIAKPFNLFIGLLIASSLFRCIAEDWVQDLHLLLQNSSQHGTKAMPWETLVSAEKSRTM